MSKLIGSDYLLLLLYLDNKKPIKGAIRLTKMMFLFNEEIAPYLKKKGLPLLDKNMRQATSEEQIKKEIVRVLK
jgi:hypothetical protein